MIALPITDATVCVPGQDPLAHRTSLVDSIAAILVGEKSQDPSGRVVRKSVLSVTAGTAGIALLIVYSAVIHGRVERRLVGHSVRHVGDPIHEWERSAVLRHNSSIWSLEDLVQVEALVVDGNAGCGKCDPVRFRCI